MAAAEAEQENEAMEASGPSGTTTSSLSSAFGFTESIRWDPTMNVDWNKETPTPQCLTRIRRDIISIYQEPPPGIFIVTDERDMTLIHALLTGLLDTPYEGGFFYLLMRCPPDYPIRPPRVKIMTTGEGRVRFNPNLYKNGKVCLSILGTWSGPCWSPAQSLSSVLISIQSLMNEKPYFNEPGFEKQPPPAAADEFVLDPVVQPGPRRRRRRRHLVVDRVTVISPEEMRNRMRVQVDNDELFRRFREEVTKPRRSEADELLGRFNTRVVPAPFRDVFQRLRTLPEPNIPDFRIVDEEEGPLAGYRIVVIFVEEPPAGELPVLDQEPPQLQPPIAEQLGEEQPIDERIFDNEPAEMRRARDTFEATMDPSAGRMVTGSSLRVPDASSATLHGTRDITVSPGRPSMVNLEDDIGLLDLDISRTRFERQEDLREAQVGQEIQQPEEDIEMADVSEQQEIPAPVRTTAPVCQYSPVSPARIPPPSSYESLTEPLETVLDFIKEHATDGVLYFERLIELEFPAEKEGDMPPRKEVAMLFNLVVHLAKEKKIELEQIIPGESIRITLPEEPSESQEV